MSTSMIILIIIVLLLLCGIFVLFLKNFSMSENLRKLKNTNQKVNTLSIVQTFIEIIGDNNKDSSEKIKLINEALIEKYDMKYSTIVVFDGEKFKIEATNVNEKHWRTFENLDSEEVFLESINKATPKYITANQGEKLPYLDVEFERAKSAIFFPIYADNIYIGYWLIEGSKSHEFDNIDTSILEVVKNNLVCAIRCLRNQKVLESMGKENEKIGVRSYEFLYSSARKTIDKYPTSIVSLVKIINLEQIEERIGTKTADLVYKNVVDYIKSNLSPEYFIAEYYNKELVVVFSGSEMDGVYKFLEDVKSNIETLKIKISGSLDNNMNGRAVIPKLNIALSTYYKETALETSIIKLDSFISKSGSSLSGIYSIDEED